MRPRVALVTTALLLLSATVAVAQNPGGPPAGGQGGFAQRRMQRLLQGITLTSDQQAKVDSIVTQYQSQMPAFTPGSPPDQATRDKMRAVLAQQDSTIRTVLTADQQKVWDANVTQMQQMRRMRSPGN
jgi:Spy/CpxP family protein refolding chaperone